MNRFSHCKANEHSKEVQRSLLVNIVDFKMAFDTESLWQIAVQHTKQIYKRFQIVILKLQLLHQEQR